MGQCNLSEPDSPNYFGDLFNSQASEQAASHLSRQNISEKDRVMWEHELTITHGVPLPALNAWTEEQSTAHPCFQQIAKDTTRTYPESSFFGYKHNLDRFQKILKKVALYFPHMGYTQGLNFIAGFLLLSGCEEQQCFTLLVRMLAHDRILAIGLYEDGFPLAKFYCSVFWALLERKLPRIFEKLKKIGIMDELWIFQWFLTLFFYNFPLEFAKRVWDFIVSKKDLAPVLVAIGIIKTLKNEIMGIELQDQIDFLEYVERFRNQQFCKSYLDLKKIFTFANSITKLELDKAIAHSNCPPSNPYKIYFSSSLINQKELWLTLMKRYQTERSAFNSTPAQLSLSRYQRSGDVIEHWQKIVLSKYKLYQSEMKKSNGSFYRRSTFSIPFSIRSCKTNNSQSFDFNKKRFM